MGFLLQNVIYEWFLDWPDVKNKLFGSETHEKIDELLVTLDKFTIKESDLNGALNGILLLLDTYKFNLTEFSAGKIQIPKAQIVDRDSSKQYFEDAALNAVDLHLLGQLGMISNKGWCKKTLTKVYFQTINNILHKLTKFRFQKTKILSAFYTVTWCTFLKS